MTVLSDLSLLDYLHDSCVSSFLWDCSDPSIRRVRLVVTIDADSEYTPWRGRLLTITMSDVVVCRLIGLGHQIGEATIDAYLEGASPEFKTECNRLQSFGITVPPFLFTLTFHNGSTLELACGEVSVEGGVD